MYKKVITLALAGMLAFSAPAAAAPSAWAEAEVTAATNAGIVPERLQSAYQDAVSREEFCEMVMLLWCKLTEEEMPQAAVTFADTQNASVAAAQSLGIVQGESATQFSPNNPVTRQEMCVMLQNAIKSTCPTMAFPEAYANTFPDAGAIADWAMEAVQSMNLFAVMLGDENGNINPLGNTTREQAILLTYRLLGTQTMSMQEYVEKYFMPVNGNSHDNMLGGAFTVGTAEGLLYYSGDAGIRAVGAAAPVVTKPAKNFLAFSKTIYYIGEDGGIYMVDLPAGAETKLADGPSDSFSAYNGALYYRNLADGGRIYKMSLETKEAAAITPGAAELPVITGEGTYYSDGTAIYKLGEDGTATPVFSGSNSYLCIKNDKFYFLNANGLISTADLNGANYTVISKLPVKSYCFTRDCLIALGRDDGAVYKIDFSGRYTIKMDTSTYVNINTYDDYVYARDAEGAIYKFSNNATEKARIN